MPQAANRLTALWSKAPTKPASPNPSSSANAAAAAVQGTKAVQVAPTDAATRREESPNHEQENRGVLNGVPSAAVQTPAPAAAQPRILQEHKDKLKAVLAKNPNPSRLERERLAKDLCLTASQVTSWFARNKPKRKSDAIAQPVARPAPPAEASSPTADDDEAQPMHTDAATAGVAYEVITLPDGEASSSGHEPTAKRLKSADRNAAVPADEPESAEAADGAAAADAAATRAAELSEPEAEQAAEPAAQQPALADAQEPVKAGAGKPGSAMQQPAAADAGKPSKQSQPQPDAPQPHTPESGQHTATAVTPTTGSPAAAQLIAEAMQTAEAAPQQQQQAGARTPGDVTPAASAGDSDSPGRGSAGGFAVATAKMVQTLLAGNAPSQEVRNALVEQYQQRIEAQLALLRSEGPVQPLPAGGERHSFSKAQVAAFVMGSPAPLSVLVERLTACMASADASNPVTDMLVQNTILELASRKSFGVKDGRAEQADALNDTTPELLWHWDVRDAKVLGKAVRPAAMERRKRLIQGQKEITALADACKALAQAATGKAAAKRAGRALEKVLKESFAATPATAPPPPAATPANATPAAQPGGTAAAAAAAAGGLVAAASPVPLSLTPAGSPINEHAGQSAEKAAKAILKEREQQEKAAQKAKKAAEQEAARAEKEAQRAAKAAEKAQKEAEREAARKQKEEERQQKEIQKKGFDKRSLQKTQNLFMTFVKKAPAKPAAPEPVVRHPEVTPEAVTGNIDAALAARSNASAAELEAGSKQILDAWSAKRGHHKRVYGLPPTWARRKDALEVLEHVHEERFGTNFSAIQAPTYRRKFIWKTSAWDFATNPKRPPFHGSFSKKSSSVRPRRPFGRDDSMDYGVESEDEWEEEPEDGEQLSDDDAMSADENAGDSEAGSGSFMVPDGYLSQEEGVSLEDDENTPPDVEMLDVPPAGCENDPDAQTRRQHRTLLASGIASAVRRNKQYIISALQAPTDSDGSAQTGVVMGNPAWLGALAAQVVTPGVYITLPPDEDAEDDHMAGVPTATATPAAPAAGRPSAAAIKARDQEVMPHLIRFLLGNPKLKAREKVIRGFREQHPSVPKSWIERHVKEDACHTGSGWTVKPDVLAAYGIEAAAATPKQHSVPAVFSGLPPVALPAAKPSPAQRVPAAPTPAVQQSTPAADVVDPSGTADAADAACGPSPAVPGSIAAEPADACPSASPAASPQAIASPAAGDSAAAAGGGEARTGDAGAQPMEGTEAAQPAEPPAHQQPDGPAELVRAGSPAQAGPGVQRDHVQPGGPARQQSGAQQPQWQQQPPGGASGGPQPSGQPAAQPPEPPPPQPPERLRPPPGFCVCGTGDPFWRALSAALASHAHDSASPRAREAQSDLVAALDIFSAEYIEEQLADVPASVVAAMVKTLASAVTADAVHWACAKGIGNLVHALSLCPPEYVDHADPTQIWSHQRSAPPAASLPALFGETDLVAAMTYWLLPPNMPLERHAELRPASQAALHLLARLVKVGVMPATGTPSRAEAGSAGASAGPLADAAAETFRSMLLDDDDVDDWCKALGAILLRHNTDRRAAVLAALVASALTADEATRDKLSEADAVQFLARPLLEASMVKTTKGLAKHAGKAVFNFLMDDAAVNMMLYPFGTARNRDDRRHHIGDYFGARLSPEWLEVESDEESLMRTIQVISRWLEVDEKGGAVLLEQPDPHLLPADEGKRRRVEGQVVPDFLTAIWMDEARYSFQLREAAREAQQLLEDFREDPELDVEEDIEDAVKRIRAGKRYVSPALYVNVSSGSE